MNGTSLTGADLQVWMALRRVSDGEVTMLGECWQEGGHQLPTYITDALTALCQRGLVMLTEREPGGVARAVLTGNGTARYEYLSRTALGISGGIARSQGLEQGRDDPDQ